METVKDLEKQLHHAENDLDTLTYWISTGFCPDGATISDLENDYNKVQDKIKELKSKIRKAKKYESREQ